MTWYLGLNYLDSRSLPPPQLRLFWGKFSCPVDVVIWWRSDPNTDHGRSVRRLKEESPLSRFLSLSQYQYQYLSISYWFNSDVSDLRSDPIEQIVTTIKSIFDEEPKNYFSNTSGQKFRHQVTVSRE